MNRPSAGSMVRGLVGLVMVEVRVLRLAGVDGVCCVVVLRRTTVFGDGFGGWCRRKEWIG